MKDNKNEQVDLNFANIVISLSQAAMIGMGRIPNPSTGNTKKDMNMAKVNIDILQMLKDKTKGNLSEKEEEILSDTLNSIQQAYDETKKQEGEKEK